MKSFVIGDIQGCYKGLRAALKKAEFNPVKDKLYAVGDLVARGQDSLNTVKYLMDLGEHFDTVLGNHDLHLIAIAHGIRSPKPQDNLTKLISDKSFSKVVDWLIKKPLAIKPAPKTLITHAGLYPKWSIKQAKQFSKEIQKQLQSPKSTDFLKDMYGNQPDLWQDELSKKDASRFITNAMTRMRYLTPEMKLEFTIKCHPSVAPRNLQPWFEFENVNLKPKHKLIFGHWASLNGVYKSHQYSKSKIIGLDTGYVWGNKFSILNLKNDNIIHYYA